MDNSASSCHKLLHVRIWKQIQTFHKESHKESFQQVLTHVGLSAQGLPINVCLYIKCVLNLNFYEFI